MTGSLRLILLQLEGIGQTGFWPCGLPGTIVGELKNSPASVFRGNPDSDALKAEGNWNAMNDTAVRPNKIPWPPLIYAGCALVAVVLHYVYPLAWPSDYWKLILMLAGLALLIVALLIEIAAIRAFRRHKTNAWRSANRVRFIDHERPRPDNTSMYLSTFHRIGLRTSPFSIETFNRTASHGIFAGYESGA